MSHREIILRLLLALVIGGIAGIEREKSRQWAGFRTHILVAIGSCVASITSILLFHEYRGFVNLDPGRISAQVLSGIGFLGAGAILKTTNTIRGLTTAAGIWVVASIGVAIGFGYYYLSIMSWLILMLTLYILKFIEKKIVLSKTSIFYIKTLNISETTSKIVSILERNRIVIKNIDISQSEDDSWNIKLIIFYNSKVSFKGIVEKILEINGIMKIDYED